MTTNISISFITCTIKKSLVYYSEVNVQIVHIGSDFVLDFPIKYETNRFQLCESKIHNAVNFNATEIL